MEAKGVTGNDGKQPHMSSLRVDLGGYYIRFGAVG